MAPQAILLGQKDPIGQILQDAVAKSQYEPPDPAVLPVESPHETGFCEKLTHNDPGGTTEYQGAPASAQVPVTVSGVGEPALSGQ